MRAFVCESVHQRVHVRVRVRTHARVLCVGMLACVREALFLSPFASRCLYPNLPCELPLSLNKPSTPLHVPAAPTLFPVPLGPVDEHRRGRSVLG